MTDWRLIYPSVSVTVQPAVEPVTVAEGMEYAQAESTTQADIELFGALLTTARIRVEKDTGLALISQTRTFGLDRFPCSGSIMLRVAPIQSVAVKYVTDGVLTTIPQGQVQVDMIGSPGRVAPALGYFWPAPDCGVMNAVQVEVECGYGDCGDAVPAPLKTAIKLLAREWWYNRCPAGELGGVASTYRGLLSTVGWRSPL